MPDKEVASQRSKLCGSQAAIARRRSLFGRAGARGQSFDSVAPDHTRPLLDWKQLPATHQQRGIHIDARTATTLWRGEVMDYGLAVEVLLQHAKRRRNVSAENSE